MGKVSKVILDTINTKTRSISKANQWRNTMTVIDWFKHIPDKDRCTFVVFDIVDTYPSISSDLPLTALSWAKTFTNITRQESDAIMHARQSLLFNNDKPWAKRNSSSNFDVTMGSYDGAEVCELIGLYILTKLEKRLNQGSIGLYRDDGLAVFKNVTARTANKVKNEITQVFSSFGLKITVQANLKSVDFLDVSLNLQTCRYQPYRKPGDRPIYVNSDSNHPPSVLKHVPTGVISRIKQLSCDQEPILILQVCTLKRSKQVDLIPTPQPVVAQPQQTYPDTHVSKDEGT